LADAVRPIEEGNRRLAQIAGQPGLTTLSAQQRVR
jgi:hypothetical protein